MRGNKILVSGSNGQVGSELRDLAPQFPEYEFVFADRNLLPLDDLEKAEAFISETAPDYLINCAAYTAVDRAEDEKELALLVNATAPALFARICSGINCRMLHISTDYVFNGTSRHPWKIEDPKGPLNVYGQTKLEGEEQVRLNNKDAIIIRTSWVYSAYGKNFVKTMLRLMQEKGAVQVVDDQVGSPTYAADLAQAMLHIISGKNWVPGIYHFSNRGAISWYQFAQKIRDLFGIQAEVRPTTSASFPTPAKRPAYSVMDTSLFEATFHLEMKNWEVSLEECLNKLAKS